MTGQGLDATFGTMLFKAGMVIGSAAAKLRIWA
jgi:hypothetical protein